MSTYLFNKAVSVELKHLLEGSRLTCVELSKKTGIPRSTINRYINARTPIPLYAYIRMVHAMGGSLPDSLGRVLTLMVDKSNSTPKATQVGKAGL